MAPTCRATAWSCATRPSARPGCRSRSASSAPEHGFYVRRQQTAELHLPLAVAAGEHEVDLTVELAGVTSDRYLETVRFA